MRTIKMTNGADMVLDGDLLTVLETLYVQVSADIDTTFEDMVREIQNVIDQMTEEERKQCFSESLFLNMVSYENERLRTYMDKLGEQKEEGREV